MIFSKRDVEKLVENTFSPNWCEVEDVFEHGNQVGYTVLMYEGGGVKRHLSILIDVIAKECD